MNTYSGHITELKEDEVFVFTSNLAGFHGAGSAGYATFNESGNVWRKYNYDEWENSAKGKWNVKGQGKGAQIGEIGKSYAIPTVTKAGAQRSIEPNQITANIKEMYEFATKRPHLKFYVAQDAAPGLNGYSLKEMVEIYKNAGEIPDNVYFQEEFAELLKN